MWLTHTGSMARYATLYLRLALAAGFLTSVSDRFGLWGAPGRTNVAWGDFQRFTAYTGQLNPWVPGVLIPPLAWFVTAAETVLGFALILGFRTRYAALASGVLLGLFALGMTVGTGLKAALNYSVFAASAGAFALAIVDSLADQSKHNHEDRRHRTQSSLPHHVHHMARKDCVMSAKENVDVMLEIFAAIERRDAQRVSELCEVDVELSWPPPLPYAGVSRGLGAQRPSWTETWVPLQPTASEQTMDPRVVAATDHEVVILWRQRGASRTGDRCDSPVLGLYQVHRGKLARAQMFYFDPVAVSRFIATAQPHAA